jgi:CheY-like chemotaxis protein
MTRTLLIVEDDFGQRKRFAEMFKGTGYDVSFARGILDARSQIDSKGGFDGYIVDWLLIGETGAEIAKLPSVSVRRNVIFVTARPSLVYRQKIEGARVWDKAKSFSDLIKLLQEIVPVASSFLVTEVETAERGERLIADIKKALKREHGTASLDSHVSVLCQDFMDTVINDRSSDINKYISASDAFVRCLNIIGGPLMLKSRRVCLKSYSKLQERLFFCTHQYLKWSFWKLWGLMTGYGHSILRMASIFLSPTVVCVLLMAIMPDLFNFSINHTDLATIAGGDRWWSSIYIAGCHALLVSTETGAPLSTAAQAMVLAQTVNSVVMLALFVSTITSHMKRDG